MLIFKWLVLIYKCLNIHKQEGVDLCVDILSQAKMI